MSGYGGNLTYPALRVFSNTDPSQFTGFIDPRYVGGTPASAGTTTRFIYDTVGGGSIANLDDNSTALVVETVQSVAKVTEVRLNDETPCVACPYDFGFGIKTVARKPGVMNSLFYGKVRPYYSSTDFLSDDGTGHITAADHVAQTEEVTNLIVADTGLSNVDTEQKGAVVLIKMGVPINDVAGTIVVSVPGFASFSVTLPGSAGNIAAIDAAITTASLDLYLQTTTIDSVEYITGFYTAESAGTIQSGFGVVQTSTGTVALTTNNLIWLQTKPLYQDKYTFEVQELTGGTTFVDTTAGNFLLMGSDDVYVLFAHRRNDRGFANMWRQEKPGEETIWYKLILTSISGTAAIHGASHGDNYKQQMEIYLPELGGTGGATAVKTYLDALVVWWELNTGGTLPTWTP